MMVWAPSPKAAPTHNPTEGAKIEEIPEGQADGGTGVPDAAALPLRAAYVHVWAPRERVGLTFDPASEGTGSVRTEVPEAELRSLDSQLAPYPFAGLDGWKALTTCISAHVVEKAVPGGKLDALSQVKGETFDGKDKDAAAQEFLASTQASAGAPELHLPVFDLRRSWPEGSEAGDVSRWSVDKSKLWERLAGEAGGRSQAAERQTKLTGRSPRSPGPAAAVLPPPDECVVLRRAGAVQAPPGRHVPEQARHCGSRALPFRRRQRQR